MRVTPLFSFILQNYKGIWVTWIVRSLAYFLLFI